jgi:transcriptional regulator with XRE-family HTH domain
MTAGSLIRETREAERLTQAALAARMGVTQPAIARIEAAGDQVTVTTLQRALKAMGRALEIRAVERPKSIDESLLHETLRLTPDQRLQQFERWYGEMQEVRQATIEAQRVGAA